MTPEPTTPAGRRRPLKPLETRVVETDEPMDFSSWAARYAATVTRVYREEQATAGEDPAENVKSRL